MLGTIESLLIITFNFIYFSLTLTIKQHRIIRLATRKLLSKSSFYWVALSFSALLNGCAVGPDFKKPEAPLATGYAPQPLHQETAVAPGQVEELQKYNATAAIPFDWWTMFHSPQINSLIERAFKASPTIQSAQAALRQSQQNVIAQEGFFYPTLGANYSPSRNKLGGNSGGNSLGLQGNGRSIQTVSNPAGPIFVGPVYYNYHIAQLTVGFVPDVFGGNRRQVESLQAQLNAQHFELEATYITLASNVVAAALQEASLRSQIDVMQKIINYHNENLEVMRKQLKLGFIAELDVASQESVKAQAEQVLIPMRKQLEQTRDLIRALAGNLPNEDVPEKFELASLQLPQELPISLPSQLVEQRPDIRAAQEQLHSASAEVGVAVASRLPQFAMTGAIGGMASTPYWMFQSGGPFFALLGSVSKTLFDGGTLKAKERAAREHLVQVSADYRNVVITAFQNVADTLHAIQSDADFLKAATRSEHALKVTAEITRKQYKLGYVSYQIVVLAEQNHQQSLINLIQAQTNRFGDAAALYQALGGGWWNRPKPQVGANLTPSLASPNEKHVP
jgi:NodT family efflux transporter outer membrane factor (OMF) lipoprotein